MTINIRYFASLKERVGKTQQKIDFIENESLINLWTRVNKDLNLPTNTLAAINQEYVDLQTLIKDGDEVAFFPPVTGG
ncbi:MAG: MoaD/ThiS family protein [Methylococcaceae bacterium]